MWRRRGRGLMAGMLFLVTVRGAEGLGRCGAELTLGMLCEVETAEGEGEDDIKGRGVRGPVRRRRGSSGRQEGLRQWKKGGKAESTRKQKG